MRKARSIDPRAMPLTGLANAAIDRVAPDPAAFARASPFMAKSDLLYYRAEGPASLVARQAELWDPILAWAQQRYDVVFELATGIIHMPQPRRDGGAAPRCGRRARSVRASPASRLWSPSPARC